MESQLIFGAEMGILRVKSGYLFFAKVDSKDVVCLKPMSRPRLARFIAAARRKWSANRRSLATCARRAAGLARQGAPQMPRDEALLSHSDYDAIVAAFRVTGFSGANAWYLNDDANLAYANEAPNFGRLSLPVLFLHAAWDTVCDSANTALADPMRADCADLSEVTIEGGHELQLDRPDEVNAALEGWLIEKALI